MEAKLNDLTAICSDSQNGCSWLVMVFKNKRYVNYIEKDHKPTEIELKELLRKYVDYEF